MLDPFGLYEHVAEAMAQHWAGGQSPKFIDFTLTPSLHEIATELRHNIHTGESVVDEPVQKFDPYHDALGRFASATTAGEDAAIARLGAGNTAILSDANQVHSFLGQLYDISQHAKRLGQNAPLYDLGKVSVPGTNLFTQDNIGIPRAKMPQLSGVPLPGSKADAFPRNVNGEVDLAPAFKDYLAKQHISMVATSVRADHLRATQDELNGAKVAGIAHAIETGNYHPASIFVSKDHYILDGHHRWAAVVGESDPRHPIHMPVERINLDIRHLVPLANKFAADMGLPQVSAGDVVQKYNRNHDARGRFASSANTSGANGSAGSYDTHRLIEGDLSAYHRALRDAPNAGVDYGNAHDTRATLYTLDGQFTAAHGNGLLPGKDLAHGIDDWSASGYQNLKEAAKDALIGRVDPDRDARYTREAQTMIQTAEDGPPTTAELYRGRALSFDSPDRAADFRRYTTVGNEFDYPLVSFSTNKDKAYQFGSYSGDQLHLTIKPGAHTLPAHGISSFDEAERIVTGRMRVVDHTITQVHTTTIHNVTLEPIGKAGRGKDFKAGDVSEAKYNAMPHATETSSHHSAPGYNVDSLVKPPASLDEFKHYDGDLTGFNPDIHETHHVLTPKGPPLNIYGPTALAMNAGGWNSLTSASGKQLWFKPRRKKVAKSATPTPTFDPFDLANHFAFQFIAKFNPYHDSHGRFTSASGGSGASGAASSIKVITATDMNHTDRSRAVSREEFLALATEGRDRLQHFIDTGSPPTYLDAHFADISSHAFAESQKPWGGVTVDTHTGKHVASDADLYALTVKDPGQDSVTIDEHAPRTTFDKAMRVARRRFAHQLARSQAHLGVFHDDDQHRIDIDPVLVVDNLHDVETIGAYTHAVGGAYHFASGNGFWPPHVADAVTKATHSLGIPENRVPIARFLAGSRDASRPVLTDTDLDAELADDLDDIVKYNPNQPRDQDGRWVGHGITTPGVSTDYGSIPAKYAAAMAAKAATLGITNEALDTATAAMLDRGNKAHANWYLQAHDAIGVMASRYNVTGDTAAGVVAALSPAREFGKNMHDAETILRVMHENKPFTPTAAAVEAYNAHRDPKRPIARLAEYRPSQMEGTTLVGLHPELSKLGNKTGLANVVRGVIIARTGHVDANLSGPKMRSFYNNLADPRGNDVTIDTWMYRAMVPKTFRFASGSGVLAGRTLTEAEHGDATHKATKLQNIFQGAPGKMVGTGIAAHVGLYPMFAESVRRVAKARGLKPHAAQAMIWEVARSDGGYKPTDMSKLLAPWQT